MPAILRGRSWLRLSARRHTALAALLVTSVVGVAPAAQAAPPGTVENTPRVRPIAECVIQSHRTSTFWFGYEVPLSSGPLFVPSGTSFGQPSSTNSFVEAAADGSLNSTANRGQVEHFTPGVHERAFAVTVKRGSQLKWSVVAASDVAALGDAALVTVSTDGVPACPRRTPTRSATLQSDRGSPDILAVVGKERVVDGLLVRASVELSLANAVSACSAGGTPLPPLVLWGFDDTVVQASVGVSEDVPRDGFRPLPRRAVVRTDVFGSDAPYQRTYESTRVIRDPQREFVDTASGVRSHGLAVTMVLADAYGRCRFGHDVVVSNEPMWVNTNGLPTLIVTITDEETQSTVPQRCTLEPGCPVTVVTGPGAARWR